MLKASSYHCTYLLWPLLNLSFWVCLIPVFASSTLKDHTLFGKDGEKYQSKANVLAYSIEQQVSEATKTDVSRSQNHGRLGMNSALAEFNLAVLPFFCQSAKFPISSMFYFSSFLLLVEEA